MCNKWCFINRFMDLHNWIVESYNLGLLSPSPFLITKENKDKTLFCKNISPRLLFLCICFQRVFVFPHSENVLTNVIRSSEMALFLSVGPTWCQVSQLNIGGALNDQLSREVISLVTNLIKQTHDKVWKHTEIVNWWIGVLHITCCFVGTYQLVFNLVL